MEKIILSPNGEINTLKAAVEKARQTGIRHILVRPGLYCDTHVELGKEDNGLIIEGDGTGEAVFSGSVPVSGFEKDEKTGYLKRKLDFDETPDFRMLVAGGKYLHRARFPHTGKLLHETKWDVPWMSTFGNGWKRKPTHEELTTFQYKPEDIPENFNWRNAEVIVYHDWDESFTGVVGMDREKHTFTLSPECFHPPGAFFHQEYVFFNVAEGMHAPLDWYFDKQEKTVYIWPDDEMTAENLVVELPLHTRVLVLTECQNITLKGLTFEGCSFDLKPAGFGGCALPAAIDGCNLDGLTVQNVTVRKSGGSGLRTNGKNISVLESSFFDLGGAGVWVGINDEYEITPYEEQEQYCSSKIENCLVHHIGLDTFAAIGIFGRHCDILGNRVWHAPYSGINMGGNNVRVEHNIVTDCMRELNDGAAIYSIGYKNGFIRDNIVADISHNEQFNSACHGIYLDEHSEAWTVERNILKDCDAPFACHMNFPGNIFENNLVTCKGKMVIGGAKSEELVFKNNVFKAGDGLQFRVGPKALTPLSGNTFIFDDGTVELCIINDQYQPVSTEEMALSDSNIVTRPAK